jgi:hypothetical protein
MNRLYSYNFLMKKPIFVTHVCCYCSPLVISFGARSVFFGVLSFGRRWLGLFSPARGWPRILFCFGILLVSCRLRLSFSHGLSVVAGLCLLFLICSSSDPLPPVMFIYFSYAGQSRPAA